MRASITIKMTDPNPGTNPSSPVEDEECHIHNEGQKIGKIGSGLPEVFGPYSDEFVTYLDRCYSLMEEVWSYKRNLESVEDFWERVVLEPDRRFAAELARPAGAKRKKKRNFSHNHL
jgi:hypothetical protein